MIISHNELSQLRSDYQDSTIALRLGCYDLLHAGHQEGIEVTAAQADILVVGVMPDAYVRRTKGPDRPINPEATRVSRIDELDKVDFSFITGESKLGVAGMIRALRPNVYVEASEHRSPMSGAFKKAFLGRLGVRYLEDTREKTESSSLMIATLGLEEAIRQSGIAYRAVPIENLHPDF